MRLTRFTLGGLLLVLPLLAVAQETKPAAAPAGIDATLEWGKRVELGTPVSGVVAEVPVAVGDRVTAGQELVRLDPRRFEADLARAKAELKRQELARKEARQELDRAEELYARTVISAHDLEQARIDFASVDASLAAARAAATQAQVDYDDSVVRAPMDGVVVRRRVDPGQTVVSRLQSQPLVVVASDATMHARARLGTEAVAKLKVGQKVRLNANGVSHEGRVSELGLEPVEEFGMPEYHVVVEFTPSAAAGQLRAGQSVKVMLP